MRPFRPAAILGLALFTLQHASGSLIFDDASPFSLTGIGRPPVILTIHGPANSDTESGCVGWDGIGDVIGAGACGGTGSLGGNEGNGASQTATISMLDAGIRSAADLRVLFVPREPRGGDITLDNLVLRVISPDGTTLFTSGPFITSMVVSERFPQPKFGFLYRIPSDELASIPLGTFDNLNNRIGLSATVSGASGGPERFSVLSWDAGSPEPVPEPATLLLTCSALLAALLRRRR